MILPLDIVHIVVYNLDMDEMLIEDRTPDEPYPGEPVTHDDLRRAAIDLVKDAMKADAEGDTDARDYFLAASDRIADRFYGATVE